MPYKSSNVKDSFVFTIYGGQEDVSSTIYIPLAVVLLLLLANIVIQAILVIRRRSVVKDNTKRVKETLEFFKTYKTVKEYEADIAYVKTFLHAHK